MIAMRQQILEHLEYLAPQRAEGPGPGQGIELSVEDTIGEGVAHGGTLRTALVSAVGA